ncbi:hypothetical protein IE4803_CH01931 [Rhizobium etli bv. phaseoli str. IE4803]|uniref:Uncharacterized protein n=1 Tax=Rhizobium etli bv. mimosae str. IE4771 TaxID=1432050 RepID=A0A060HW22_RHIET|nr:hypothetical protein IE4771_CH02006 [Rhizobium sp. IE4771]AJC79133.1 hypothetical protein IE4803_CH01931 [Rhizobium etli bv. phaseoli str. IE4803]
MLKHGFLARYIQAEEELFLAASISGRTSGSGQGIGDLRDSVAIDQSRQFRRQLSFSCSPRDFLMQPKRT